MNAEISDDLSQPLGVRPALPGPRRGSESARRTHFSLHFALVQNGSLVSGTYSCSIRRVHWTFSYFLPEWLDYTLLALSEHNEYHPRGGLW
jgi:hypothetical protein